MKIAITGGAGFIGTALARDLKAQDHDLRLLDLKKSETFPEDSVIADVTDGKALTEATKSVDVIYHLAAEHRDDVQPTEKYYDVNAGGAANIVTAAQINGIKTIIFTSSVAVYGLKPADPREGSREIDPPAPFNHYGQSKLEAEQIFENWAAERPERTLVTVRLVATFGPGNRGNIHTLMDTIARRRFVMIGRGKNRKSIAYLENVSAFLAYLLKLPQGQYLYNYADKPDIDTKSLVHMIRRHFGLAGTGPRLPYIAGLAGGAVFDLGTLVTRRTFPISRVRIQKFCAETIVNAERIQNTGFKPAHSLEDGLKNMLDAEFPNAKNHAKSA